MNTNAPDPQADANRRAIRRFLAKQLDRADIPAGLRPDDYRKWTVDDEDSLNEISNFCKSTLMRESFKLIEKGPARACLPCFEYRSKMAR